MSLLQVYLSKSNTQRVLKLKPGEQGFSLIELVVVVAVLAILSAIAVPAYMGMQEQAADSAARANLKNAYKECAYQAARGIANGGGAITAQNPAKYDFPQNDQFYTYSQVRVGSTTATTNGECATTTTNNNVTTTTPNNLIATKTSGTQTGSLAIDLDDGDRTATTISW
tara:strand:- start:1654 stop:2160 length:507 start_codon:yes stop_codon:yes gene_type:complete